MHHLRIAPVTLLAFAALVAACERPTDQGSTPGAGIIAKKEVQEDPVVQRMREINAQLAAQGYSIAVEAIEYFTIGQGRPSNRIHQTPFRWVPNDARRLAQGTDITYLVDQSDGATFQLTNAQTEAAIDAALATWAADPALTKVTIVKRADSGADPDIFDFFFGFGGFGNPFLADITNAGWLPAAFFAAVTGAPNNVLAFSVTFIFVDGSGNPTDINGDNYLDTALNEVYYNLRFGEPATPRAGNPWGINVVLPGIDVETVALHENGHSLELGHFGPPPAAVMNPVYAGIRHVPFAADDAGMYTVWGSWPNP
jgi:hypothetical protein